MDLEGVRPLGAALGDESFVWLRLGHRVRRAGRSMKNVLGTGIFRRRLSLTSKGYDIMHRTCGAKTAATILSKTPTLNEGYLQPNSAWPCIARLPHAHPTKTSLA